MYKRGDAHYGCCALCVWQMWIPKIAVLKVVLALTRLPQFCDNLLIFYCNI